MSRVIDPHIHLFDLEQGNYGWLEEEQEPHWPDKAKITRDYSEGDLFLGDSITLEGFVHIEAGFDNESPWRELAWLENHCELPFKSIAYGNVSSEIFVEQLDQLTAFASLVGIRFILEQNAEALLKNDVVRKNLALMAEKGLLFEAQLPLADSSAVDALCQLMSELPSLRVVINHTGLPEQLSESWMESVMRLAHHPECHIKCSGWEMFDRDWSAEKIKPLVSFAIRQFGLTRVMLASNFPVSELSCSYQQIWQCYLKEMKWKGFEKEMLVYENAKRIYQFG